MIFKISPFCYWLLYDIRARYLISDESMIDRSSLAAWRLTNLIKIQDIFKFLKVLVSSSDRGKKKWMENFPRETWEKRLLY